MPYMSMILKVILPNLLVGSGDDDAAAKDAAHAAAASSPMGERQER